MREPREFDLQWEGRRCIVQELGAAQARQVARRVANVFGAAVREAGAAGVDRDVMVAAVMAGGSVLERLDDQTLEWLTQTFIKVTQVETAPGSETWVTPREMPDFVFGGGEGLARWFRWLAFCLDMTCSDFFAVAFSEIRRLQTKAGVNLSGSSASPIPSPQNGARPSPSTSTTPGIFTGSP
jgi:hypothetical protein